MRSSLVALAEATFLDNVANFSFEAGVFVGVAASLEEKSLSQSASSDDLRGVISNEEGVFRVFGGMMRLLGN